MGKRAFSLIEILIAAALLTAAFAGILSFTSYYLRNLESSRNYSIALAAAKEQLERIKSLTHPTDEALKITFANLPAMYNNRAFDVYAENSTAPLPNFKGVSYVTTKLTTPLTVYTVKVVVCWKETGNVTIGEDKNINGALDSGEDASPENSELDSPVSLSTDIVNME